nr:MAG TPA: hypothetical protein [Caudoviricetes sp.]
MKRASTAEEKANRGKALKAKTKSKSPSTGGGMKKDVQVKSYTRRTKSGKVVTVKAHTAKREAAKKTPSKVRRTISDKEYKRRELRAEREFDRSCILDVMALDIFTEGTLDYKKGKTTFDTLVNAISSLCTTEKGKYGFSHEDAPIEDLFKTTRWHQVTDDFYKAVCSGVKKKLGASISSAPSGVIKELSRNARPLTKLDKAKEVERIASNAWRLDSIIIDNDDLKDNLQEMRRDSARRQRARKGLLKIND